MDKEWMDEMEWMGEGIKSVLLFWSSYNILFVIFLPTRQTYLPVVMVKFISGVPLGHVQYQLLH